MDTIAFLPIVTKLGTLLRQGLDHYAAARAMGVEVNAESVATFLEAQVADWNPAIHGRRVLNGPAKHHGAHFLAHIVCALGDKE